MPKREPFTNKSVEAPRKDKPHIVLRAGWWRVSPLLRRRSWPAWNAAHQFAARLNGELGR